MHLTQVSKNYEKIRNSRMTRLLSGQSLMVIVLCAAAVGVGAQSASAVVILSEDFESYDMDNPFPGSAWTGVNVGSGNTYEPDASAQSTLSAGTQGLLAVDNDTTSTAPSGLIEFDPVLTGASATHNLRLTFDVNMADADNLSTYLVRLVDTGQANNQIGPAMLLDRSTGDPPIGGAGAVWVWNGPSNNDRFVLGVNDGTSNTDHGTPLTPDEWHRIVVDVFMADFQYQVTIDGGTPSPLLNWVGAPVQLNRINLADTFASFPANPDLAIGGAIYFDNFLVERLAIPEPLSAVLMGIGLMLLSARRRFVG